MIINKTDYALLHRALVLAQADYARQSCRSGINPVLEALYIQRSKRARELREELDGKATKNSKRVAATPAQDKG